MSRRAHWVFFIENNLGPAKTYILRGTPRTYAIKTRVATDNSTIKTGLRKGNRWPRKGEGPVNCTKPLLIAPVPVTVLIVGLRADRKGPFYRSWPDLKNNNPRLVARKSNVFSCFGSWVVSGDGRYRAQTQEQFK